MSFLKKISTLICFMAFTVSYAQTPGLNYQALILNSEEIQIPGTNVKENQLPLGLEEVTFRFTITDENGVEYVEEHTVTTDVNGMVSLIVGEGRPITATFDSIIWDGELKYLIVDLNILSNTTGFEPLDKQKILYIPHPTNGTASVYIASTLLDITPPYNTGDLVWVQNYNNSSNPTLLIFDGTNWVPASNDYDPTNELGLVVVADNADRDTLFNPSEVGDQVWNQACGCIEVFDGTNWISTNTPNLNFFNGLTKVGEDVKLGGNLTEPTIITTDATNTLAIEGLEESTSTNDKIVVVDATTGVLKTTSLSSFAQQQQLLVTANNGQLRFTTPLPTSTADKIDIYRNGARISFTIINTNTIELESEARCYAGDEIRIVQLN
jgi:hypothetical protein